MVKILGTRMNQRTLLNNVMPAPKPFIKPSLYFQLEVVYKTRVFLFKEQYFRLKGMWRLHVVEHGKEEMAYL
jgi:hypothetical protein